MITLAIQKPLDPVLLTQQLAEAGLPTDVVHVVGDRVDLLHLKKRDTAAARAVLDRLAPPDEDEPSVS